MIIIEGPDGSGKSTLARMLHAAFQIPRMHSFKELPINAEIANERFLWNEAMLGLKIIMDRCYVISEYVYGPILREKSLITDDQFNRFIQRMNHTSRVVYIFCDTFFDHVISEETADRELESEKHWDEITIKYREIYKKIRCERWVVKSSQDYSEVLWTIRRVWEWRPY